MTESKRNFVAQDVLITAYKEAAASGKTIHDVSTSLGIQPASIMTRVKTIRKQLVSDCSLTPEQAEKILPDLPRKSGSGRKAGVSDFVRNLAESILTDPENSDGESV
jgi:hypothetical protein